MDDDVVDLLGRTDPLFEANLLEEGLALLPPRTTEYRSGAVGYRWPDVEEPATQPLSIPTVRAAATPAPSR